MRILLLWTLPSQSGHVAVHIAWLVDGQVIGCAHIVGRMDGLGTKAQVADGHAATLLGIVLEVGLDVTVRHESHNKNMWRESSKGIKMSFSNMCLQLKVS